MTEPENEARLDVIEDHLVKTYRARAVVGFPPLYAALSVATVVLLWFPFYDPFVQDDHTTTYPPLLGPNSWGIFYFMILVLPMLLAAVSAMSRPDRETLVTPIAIALFSALDCFLVLTRVSARHYPELSGTGNALVTVLFATTVTAICHAVAVSRLQQPEPSTDT